MANLEVGKKRRYTAVPKDKNQQPAPTDTRVAPVWRMEDGTLMSLEADPNGNPLVNIGTVLAKGETHVMCDVDADLGDGMKNLTITSAMQTFVDLGAEGGTIEEEDL